MRFLVAGTRRVPSAAVSQPSMNLRVSDCGALPKAGQEAGQEAG